MREVRGGKVILLVVSLLVGSAAARGAVVSEFTVDARENATATPLATGLHVKAGQVLVFAPNKDDRWSSTKSGNLDYRGRSKPPSMKLCMKLGALNQPVSDQMTVTAPSDGELFLYSQNQWGAEAKGAIRVKVTIADAPAPAAVVRPASATGPASAPGANQFEFLVDSKRNPTKTPLATGHEEIGRAH